MRGYRDTMGVGPHAVRLDGVDLAFGAEGVLWDPTPEQEAVLTKDAHRTTRFEPVEPVMGKSPVADDPVAGAALFGGELAEDDAATDGGGRKRRRG